jgi:hypothetical protein
MTEIATATPTEIGIATTATTTTDATEPAIQSEFVWGFDVESEFTWGLEQSPVAAGCIDRLRFVATLRRCSIPRFMSKLVVPPAVELHAARSISSATPEGVRFNSKNNCAVERVPHRTASS